MDDLRDELDAANDLAAGLQERVDELESDLQRSDEIIDELRDAAQDVRAPAGDEELRGLASTVRNCQRDGHPDLATHLDNLLKLLGA